MALRTEARFGYIPHFDITTVDGRHVRYQDMWQRRNLVLIVVTADQHAAALGYAQRLMDRQREFEQAETDVIVTTDGVFGFSPPRVIIADRWGEILHIASPPSGQVSQLPSVDEVLSWVRFAGIQCPECPP